MTVIGVLTAKEDISYTQSVIINMRNYIQTHDLETLGLLIFVFVHSIDPDIAQAFFPGNAVSKKWKYVSFCNMISFFHYSKCRVLMM